MIPSLYTYDGHEINNGTVFSAKILAENEAQGGAVVTHVQRPFTRPIFAGKSLSSYQMNIGIEIKTSAGSNIDVLKGYFDIEDFTPHALIIKDTNNSSKQWYVNGTCKKFLQMAPNYCVVTLDISDPVWLAVSATTSSNWSVTASGQTNTYTIAGNVNAHPVITIKPTAVRGAGYAYKRFCAIRNRVTSALVNYPYELTQAGWDTTGLVAYTTNHVHLNGGIDASVTTIPYNSEAGTMPTYGAAMIENEQILYTGKSGGNLTGVTRGANGTTAASHNTGTQVNQSLIQADGDDIRVFVDGKEVPRWLQGVNTSTTKVWVSQDWKAPLSLSLKTTIDDNDLTLAFDKNADNRAILAQLPSKGLLLIGTELLRYSSIDLAQKTITVSVRGANGSTAAAHTAGDVVYWIEHEIWILYGNTGTACTNPSTNDTNYDTKKPIFNLTSTNVSWDYDNFKDKTGQRAGVFTPSIITTANNRDTVNKSKWWTGSRNTSAYPATDMGAQVAAWLSAGVWKGDNAAISWDLYNPCGFTTVTASGEKYRTGTTWATLATCQYSDDGKSWTDAWTSEATPGTASTWTALAAHSSVSLSGTREYIRFYLEGTIGATASALFSISYQDVTIVPDTNYIPLGTLGAEQSNYQLNIILKNNTTGESVEIDTGMLLNSTLTIDCLNKTITITGADTELGTDKAGAIVAYSSVRNQWLDLQPGANELQIDDVDTTGTLTLTVNVSWQDRNN